MKTILLLILSAFTAFAATTYPVLTDNPLRTFSGGGTNLALLNGTNVFTGTNSFTVSPLFQGFPIVRSIYLLATNHMVTVTAGTNASQPTNAGDYALCGAVGTFTIPALPPTWTNVGFNFKVAAQKTAVGNAASQFHLYGGPATNWLGVGVNLGNGANNYFALNNFGAYTFLNLGHHTNQVANSGLTSIITGNDPANLIDTSAPWTLYVGVSTTGTTTTFDIKHIVIEAINLN